MKLISIVFVCFALLCSCSKKEEEVKAPRIFLVKTVEVISNTATIKKTTNGEFIARDTADIAFLIPGKLDLLTAIEGKEFKKGAVIARVEEKDYKFQYEKLRAEYIRAKADYDRAGILWADEAISKAEYDSKKAAYIQARANNDEAKKRLGDTRLRAPFNGIVSSVFVDNHQNVAAGQKIVTYYSRDQFDVVINIPESFVLKYRQGHKLTSFASFADKPEMKLPLKFREFSSTVDPMTRTYRLTFEALDLKKMTILPGMTLNVSLEISPDKQSQKDVYVLPVMSVLEDNDGKKYVWALTENKKSVVKKTIKVGEMEGDTIVVTDGVVVGDRIVTAGAHLLTEGVEVNLLEKEGGL